MLDKLSVPPELWVPLAAGLFLVAVLLLVGKIPLGYNVRNLVVRWRITLLTGVAFTLVVALMTVLLAFVNGMYKLTEGSGQPGNVIVLSDGATDELFSNMSYSDTSNIDNHALVLRDGNKALCSREVYVLGSQPIPPENKRRRFVQVRGLEDAVIAGKVHGLELLEGQWFSDVGVQELPRAETGREPEQAIQAVLGEGIARKLGRDLGKDRLHAGDVFELGPRKWVVVGVMKSSGSTFASEVWAKRTLVGPLYGKEQISTIVLRTAGPKQAADLAKDLTANFKTAAVQAQTETEYYSKLQATNLQFLIGIGFVTFFMGLGGVFGVMNTMFAAIAQRTKDIGVLRILGYARWQILVSFFLESLAIALVGGLLGCALGYLADGWTATSIVSSGAGGGGKNVILKLVVDAQILGLGLLISLAMGVLGGLIPSLSAMLVRPLESLR
jgi:putative ABC transport system permease protein